MGDFNMSLFKVVPELRSRGQTIGLAAWYPWISRGLHPKTMADSCGIFVTRPSTIKLSYGADIFDHPDELHQHDANGGPGQNIDVYLAKSETWRDKLEKSISECEPPAVADNCTRGDWIKPWLKPNQRLGLSFRQKPMELDIYRFDGLHHKGSHFPLATFTGNIGRRSDGAYRRRQNKRNPAPAVAGRRWDSRDSWWSGEVDGWWSCEVDYEVDDPTEVDHACNDSWHAHWEEYPYGYL